MATSIQRLKRNAACVALLSAMGLAAQAQEAPNDSSLEVTIRLLPQNAVGPEEITRRIELPPAATATRPEQVVPPEDPTERAGPAAENGRGQGPSTAPEARERGQGPSTAPEARERGQAPSTAPAARGEAPSVAPAPRERAQGPDTAAEARQRGQETADKTRENRENAGRPDERGRPNNDGNPPDQPRGPPETPPGRP